MKATLLWFVCIVAINDGVTIVDDQPINLSDKFLDAIRCVESNGDVCAIGDNGRSIGAYQIMLGYYNDAAEVSRALQTTGQGN